MQFDIFKQGAQLSAPTNVTGRATGKRRGAHILHEPRAKSFDIEGYYAGFNVPVPVFTQISPGKAEGCDELTKKRARAIGMFEGWREVVNEPVRQRVGLAGMQY